MAKVEIWTVYDHPSDYPDLYVARKFIMDKPTADIIASDNLERLRSLLPHGLSRMDRELGDDPNIVETWF